MAELRVRKIDAFVTEWANAMRTGKPGPCYVDDHDCEACGGSGISGYDREHGPQPCDVCYQGRIFVRLPYHVLPGDAVEALRESSTAGGLAYCERCDAAIFVPGYCDAGLVVRGFGDIPMKGISI